MQDIDWSRKRLFFALAGVSLGIVVVCGVFGARLFDPEVTYERTAYWYMWAHLLFLAWALGRPEVAERLLAWLRERRTWIFVAGATALTTMLCVSVEREFRVLADETNLIGTSFSLFLDRTAQNIIEGEYYFRRFHLVHAEMPTRPLLYPFAMSILHGLLGFDAEHGFLVNALASVATLVVVASFATRLAGVWLGVLAAAFLAAFPLYAQCVTASGYEVLNLLMIMLVGAQLWHFLEKPTAADAQLLVILGLLASQCRYESVLVLLPIGLAILRHAKTLLAGPLPLTMALLPILTLPTVWQRMLSTALNAGDVGKDPFPLEQLPEHLWGAVLYFLNWPKGNFATVGPVFVLALLGLGIAMWAAVMRWLAGDGRRLGYVILVGTGLGGILLVQCLYYLGDMRLAFIARMALTFVGALCMLAAFPLVRAMAVVPQLAKPAAVVAALGLCVHGWSHAAVNEHGRTLFLYREYRRTLDFVRKRGSEGILIVSDRPSMYASHGRGAVSFRWARKNGKRLLRSLKQKRYDEVLVLQHIELKTGKPEKGFEIDLELEPVWEFQNTEKILIRIAKVVGPGKSEPQTGKPADPAPSDAAPADATGAQTGEEEAGEANPT